MSLIKHPVIMKRQMYTENVSCMKTPPHTNHQSIDTGIPQVHCCTTSTTVNGSDTTRLCYLTI
jgi:hypothetical protein